MGKKNNWANNLSLHEVLALELHHPGICIYAYIHLYIYVYIYTWDFGWLVVSAEISGRSMKLGYWCGCDCGLWKEVL